MSDPITLTPEQAELVEAGEPFVVDGEWSDTMEPCQTCGGEHLFTTPAPPAEWVAADQPCPTCDGEQFWEDQIPRLADREVEPYGCGTCHGIGRTVTELLTECGAHPLPWMTDMVFCDHCGTTGKIPLGRFTVEVLPPDARPGQYTIIATKIET